MVCVMLPNSASFSNNTPASADGQHQGQAADQTIAPVKTGPTSPESLSKQPAVPAEHITDAIERLSSSDNASSQSAKDDVTVTIDSDPLDLGKHRRDGVTHKQMKADHPLAKPKHMKVCHPSCTPTFLSLIL
jgi:hypothetical protein